MIFNIEGIPISYSVNYSRRSKSIKISIYKDNTLRVTVPKYRRNISIEKVLLEKKDWILSAISENKNVIKIEDVKDYDLFKKDYLKYIKKRVDYYNTFYNLEYKNISIRRSKTRWGSCSVKNNLNFNYKIYYLPQPLSDYVIVHEICHLMEFNHSKNFWNLVEKTIPDYKEIKKRLKGYSL
jgi:predicted metal-dependent hydrolase